MSNLKIYGDNILECEEALRLLTNAFGAKLVSKDGPLYVPSFTIVKDVQTLFEVQLFPGYDRWGYDIKKVMGVMGAKLREATDAVVTKIVDKDEHPKEVPILAFEFCGALPAGNNAWQRSGRAISCAQSHIPYLYFAELGGIELGTERSTKAARFPNPIVPYAYLALGKTYDSVTLPVYNPSPSISADLYEAFKPYLAGSEVGEYIKSVLQGNENVDARKTIEQKAIGLTMFLASKRKDLAGILKPEEWKELYKLTGGREVANWLIRKHMDWKKKITIPTTDSFNNLFKAVGQLNVSAVCSKDMPFCLISVEQRNRLAQKIEEIYKKRMGGDFTKWIRNGNKPLFLAWVAGFKPRGDDSRPDRGLIPLLRMVVGEDDVDVLTIVYGPCKTSMLKKLQRSVWSLASENGLWQAVLNYSDAIVVDTKTSGGIMAGFLIPPVPATPTENGELVPSTSLNPVRFGEHDVDTVLHEVFYLHDDGLCFEGLCNPPGGNWSGISLFNFRDGIEMRWVSLPRVSGVEAKRPDHIFQIKTSSDTSNIVIIESKDTGRSVEENIGSRLIKYVVELVKVVPNIYRDPKNVNWQVFLGDYLSPNAEYFSIAAFRLTNLQELNSVQVKSKTDAVIGIEFTDRNTVCIHLIVNERTNWLSTFLLDRVGHFSGWLEVKVY